MEYGGAYADVGSAMGLREMLHNCETNTLAPNDRIKACTILLRSNLADPKMEGLLYSLIGQAHTQAGASDEAIKDYENALVHYLDYLPALINHGALEALAGKYDVALADYDKAVLADLTNATALRGRCETRLALNMNPSDVAADCTESLRLEPGNVRALMFRREAYARLGRCAESAADFDAAVKIAPTLVKMASNVSACRQTPGSPSNGD